MSYDQYHDMLHELLHNQNPHSSYLGFRLAIGDNEKETEAHMNGIELQKSRQNSVIGNVEEKLKTEIARGSKITGYYLKLYQLLSHISEKQEC